MHLSHALSIFLLSGTSLVSFSSLAAPNLQDPTLFPGGTITNLSYGRAISADGTVFVGSIVDPYYESYLWTQSGGLLKLGYAPGDIGSQGYGVNIDGTAVVGVTIDASYNGRASLWTSGTGMISLGVLAGGLNSSAADVSDDGSIVVGESEIAGSFEAFRWTSGTGMVGLGFLAGDNYSNARSISGDGSIIVGSSQGAGITKAFRWTSGTGMVDIGNLGGNYTDAWGISRDGTTIVGGGYDASSVTRAFYWTSGTGMVDISLPTHTYSIARATNLDGSTIVGYTTDGIIDGGFRWTSANGTELLKDILITAGVDMTDWILSDAWATSDDGSVIIGNGYYQGIEKAYVFSTNNGAAVTSTDQILPSVIPTTIPAQQTFSMVADNISQSLLVARNTLTSYFPNISENLKNDFSALQLSSPEKISPAAGEDYSSYLSGYKRMALFSTGTVGIGQNNDFSNYALNGSIGILFENDSQSAFGVGIIKSYDEQETRLGGESVLKANGINLLGSYEAFSGFNFYSSMALVDFDVKTDRNYLNGSGIDTSYGSTDGLGYGLSLRVGYEIPDTSQNWAIMPYSEWEWSWSSLDSYTETSGGFPVSVAKQTSQNLNGKIGIETTYIYDEKLTIRGRSALAHRFTDKGQVSVTSAIINQTLQAIDDDKTWLELGTNLNYKISDDITISGDLSGRGGETSTPTVQATIGLVWNWN